MQSLSSITDQIKDKISALPKIDSQKKCKRLWKKNFINKNYSILLSAFVDVEELASRLEKNIEGVILVEREYQSKLFFKEEGSIIPEEGQVLLRKSSKLTQSIETDFKALYIFAKIFIDKYVQYLYFLYPEDGIKSGSVLRHMNSLKSYNKQNDFVQNYRNEVMEALKKLNNTLTFYRDEYIVHSKLQENFDIWFSNDMNGGVRFIHVNRDESDQISSLNPKDLLQVCLDFISKSQKYFIDNWSCDYS